MIFEKKETMPIGRSWLNNLSVFAGIVVSIGTFYIGLVQYFYSQNLVDRRKYYNLYYDERFQAFKKLSYTATSIQTAIQMTPIPYDLPKNVKDSLLSRISVFNYAILFLDKDSPDNILIQYIEEYQDCLIELLMQQNSRWIFRLN